MSIDVRSSLADHACLSVRVIKAPDRTRTVVIIRNYMANKRTFLHVFVDQGKGNNQHFLWLRKPTSQWTRDVKERKMAARPHALLYVYIGQAMQDMLERA